MDEQAECNQSLHPAGRTSVETREEAESNKTHAEVDSETVRRKETVGREKEIEVGKLGVADISVAVSSHECFYNIRRIKERMVEDEPNELYFSIIKDIFINKLTPLGSF